VPWPPELWTSDPARWESRHDWLLAALRFAVAHGYPALPINRLMIQRRPLGVQLATVLPDECRHLARPVRRPPSFGPPRLGRG
jgi:hypothetical protein